MLSGIYMFFQHSLEGPYYRLKTMNLKLEFKAVVGRWGRYLRQEEFAALLKYSHVVMSHLLCPLFKDQLYLYDLPRYKFFSWKNSAIVEFFISN